MSKSLPIRAIFAVQNFLVIRTIAIMNIYTIIEKRFLSHPWQKLGIDSEWTDPRFFFDFLCPLRKKIDFVLNHLNYE